MYGPGPQYLHSSDDLQIEKLKGKKTELLKRYLFEIVSLISIYFPQDPIGKCMGLSDHSTFWFYHI